jgi:hypothetical protein
VEKRRKPIAPNSRVGKLSFYLGAAFLLNLASARSQDSYEIQVYPSELVQKGHTMVELHSNYTVEGERQVVNGVLPSNDAFHETLEITHGFTSWFETGFYVFSSIQPHRGWEWVGDHIRPRVAIPKEWNWPVGLSLSTEVGFVSRRYSEDDWSWEIRPIIDKQIGRWYFSINPASEKSISGLNAGGGYEFAPAVKVSYQLAEPIDIGIEYYAGLGNITHWSRGGDQQHQIFPTIDLNVSPDWEINFGVGVGLTRSTDDLILKLILGRRF